ncbi:MAG: phosphotransferase-like protein [Acidimicrobiales bacterium]|jgi:chloramphenicol 3-O-phosphotransferase
MSQAPVVHEGVDYDLVVDTSDSRPEECVTMILARLAAVA